MQDHKWQDQWNCEILLQELTISLGKYINGRIGKRSSIGAIHNANNIVDKDDEKANVFYLLLFVWNPVAVFCLFGGHRLLCNKTLHAVFHVSGLTSE